jgi:YidC/Oxa1 family membrane protein insertase
MEDQGKRLLLAVGVIAVLFIVWNTLFPPKRPQPPPPQPPAATAPTTAPAPAPAPGATAAAPAPAAAPGTAPATPGAAPAAAPAPAAPPPVACEVEKEGAPRWETSEYTAVFTRCGGGIAGVILKGAQYRETAAPSSPQINLVRTGTDPATFPLQAQVLATPPGVANPEERRTPLVPDRSTWNFVSANDDEVVYSWTSPDAGLVVTKTFRRLAAKYTFQLDVEVKNVSAKATDKRMVEPYLTLYGFQDPNVQERGIFHYAEPTWGASCYVDGSLQHDTAKQLHSETKTKAGDVRWVGLDHQYFLFAMAPLGNEQSTCSRTMVPGTAGLLRTDIDYNLPTTLEPGQSLKQSVAVYAGPKLMAELQAVSKVTGKDTKLAEAIDLGWLAFLARPMLFLLTLFHGWVLNWGIAIILLTVVVKLLTLYWAQKGMKSMKAMSKLKPEMDKIKEKYPDDKQRQNVEMMNLYKAHKISPFGGCLPLLLQMPIWFALYRSLASSADLYHAPFLYLRDLTAPDPYYAIPILLMVLMFIQAKISPTSVDSQQQKMMQWMMPIMMGVFSLLFPAGLAVYMTTNTLLGMAQQWYLNRHDAGPAKPAVVVAVADKEKPAEPPKPGPKGGAKRKPAKARG